MTDLELQTAQDSHHIASSGRTLRSRRETLYCSPLKLLTPRLLPLACPAASPVPSSPDLQGQRSSPCLPGSGQGGREKGVGGEKEQKSLGCRRKAGGPVPPWHSSSRPGPPRGSR